MHDTAGVTDVKQTCIYDTPPIDKIFRRYHYPWLSYQIRNKQKILNLERLQFNGM
jgi:hypothetical protein